jgi:hypothetical protein
MESLPSIGGIVIISDGQSYHNYIIKSINEKGIYISPIDNPNAISLLIQTSPGKWQVYGSNAPYQILFQTQIFTNLPEVDVKILNNFTDKELQVICQLNTYASTLCNRDDLWQKRIIKYLRPIYLQEKPINKTWKQYYQDLIKRFLRNKDETNLLASKTGNLFLLQLLKDNGYDYFDSYLEEAALYGYPEILKWVIENDIAPTATVADLAVKYKFYDLLRWLEQRNILPDEDGLNIAAGNGDLDLLKHYYETHNILPTDYGADYALHEGHNEVVKWLATKEISPH